MLGVLVSDHELVRTTFIAQLARFRNHKFDHPGLEHDRLFKAAYCHVGVYGSNCVVCDHNELVQRSPQTEDAKNKLFFHQGRITTGNAVIQHGSVRDQISRHSDYSDCRLTRSFAYSRGALVFFQATAILQHIWMRERCRRKGRRRPLIFIVVAVVSYVADNLADSVGDVFDCSLNGFGRLIENSVAVLENFVDAMEETPPGGKAMIGNATAKTVTRRTTEKRMTSGICCFGLEEWLEFSCCLAKVSMFVLLL